MSMTAAMARMPLRGSSCMSGSAVAISAVTAGPEVLYYYRASVQGALPRPPSAGRTKTPNPACGFIETCRFANLSLQCSGDDELRNARAALDNECMLSQIDQHDVDLTTIVGVNRAG